MGSASRDLDFYMGRQGTKRGLKAVLIGAVPPLVLNTPVSSGGLPIEVFDQLRAGWSKGFERLARLVLVAGNVERA